MAAAPAWASLCPSPPPTLPPALHPLPIALLFLRCLAVPPATSPRTPRRCSVQPAPPAPAPPAPPPGIFAPPATATTRWYTFLPDARSVSFTEHNPAEVGPQSDGALLPTPPPYACACAHLAPASPVFPIESVARPPYTSLHPCAHFIGFLLNILVSRGPSCVPPTL